MFFSRRLVFSSIVAMMALVALPQVAKAQPYVFGFSSTTDPADGRTQLSLNGGAIVLNSYDRGWYDTSGTHSPSNDNYGTGATHNTFFLFDLSSVGTSITSATMQFYNPTNGYLSPNLSETLEIHDISTSYASISAGTGGVGAYNDLGSGILYGAQTVSAADNGQVVTVTLNGSAVSALETARTGSAQWGAGAALLLAGSSAPEPGTLALLALGGAAAFVRRRRK